MWLWRRAKLPLDGLQIVLAGGAGGLGSATAELLQQERAKVIVGSRSHGVQADITNAEERERLLDAAPDMYGLVVFTGIPARGGDATMLRESFRVNCEGPILLAREAAARMTERGTQGAIVMLSTMQAVALFPGSTAYAAAKAALQHSARILAKECRGSVSIRVNVIAPGSTITDMNSEKSGKTQAEAEQEIAMTALRRQGLPEDIADATAFLATDDARWVTGAWIDVSGGIRL